MCLPCICTSLRSGGPMTNLCNVHRLPRVTHPNIASIVPPPLLSPSYTQSDMTNPVDEIKEVVRVVWQSGENSGGMVIWGGRDLRAHNREYLQIKNVMEISESRSLSRAGPVRQRFIPLSNH